MLLFMDGMAHYGTAELAAKYTTVAHVDATWAITAEGRYGSCIKRTGGDSNMDYLGFTPFSDRRGPWVPAPSGVIGFALKIDELTAVHGASGSTGVPRGLLSVMESGTSTFFGCYHFKVELLGNGVFVLRSHQTGSGDSLIATSVEAITGGAWHYVEIKWVISATAGSVEIRVNTVPVLTFTGDVRSRVSDQIGVWHDVRLFGIDTNAGSSAPLVCRFCDLYLADLRSEVVSDVDDFLGDGQIVTIFPNGVGLASAWTPASATANWDQVNDKPAPDGDASYVSATAPGLRDCHQFEDIPAGALVLGAHYNLLIRKEEEGTVTVKPIIGQGGVQYDGPLQGVGGLTYTKYLTDPQDLNPATGTAWTAAEINAGQWGVVKVT